MNDKIRRLELEVEYWKSLWGGQVHTAERLRKEIEMLKLNEQLYKALDNAEKHLTNNGKEIMRLTDELAEERYKVEQLQKDIQEIRKGIRDGKFHAIYDARNKLAEQLKQAQREIKQYRKFIQWLADTYPSDYVKLKCNEVLEGKWNE
jgi:septal ring factor EnvC (AmiA/AmiB activator)